MLIELDEDILPRHQLANSLRGSVAEWLALLGRVDPGYADFVLNLVGVEDADRVPVSNLDYCDFEDACCGAGGRDRED